MASDLQLLSLLQPAEPDTGDHGIRARVISCVHHLTGAVCSHQQRRSWTVMQYQCETVTLKQRSTTPFAEPRFSHPMLPTFRWLQTVCEAYLALGNDTIRCIEVNGELVAICKALAITSLLKEGGVDVWHSHRRWCCCCPCFRELLQACRCCLALQTCSCRGDATATNPSNPGCKLTQHCARAVQSAATGAN